MKIYKNVNLKVDTFVNQPEIYKNVNIEAGNQDRLERFEVSFPIFVRYDGLMDLVHLSEVLPFTTKDGSQIRELLSHRNSDIHRQSLAEATLPPGGATTEHYHSKTEEIYFILEGCGRMQIEKEIQKVQAGDAIGILPGQRHKLWNDGPMPLRLLCCCAPCYEHEDTILTESEQGHE